MDLLSRHFRATRDAYERAPCWNLWLDVDVLLFGLTCSGNVVGEPANCSGAFDVLVLGGGIAGTKAAATLHEGGVKSFAVVEQASRIGGRMWKKEWHGEVIELGANWIEGIRQDINPIWNISQRIGLKGNYTNQEADGVEPTLFDHQGKVPKERAVAMHSQIIDAMNGALQVFCQRKRLNLSDICLRDALTSVGWPTPEHQTPLQRTLEFFVVDWDFQFSPDEVSLFNYYAVGKPAATFTMDICGGKRITSLRARRSRVGGFSWEAPRYFITDPRGYSAVADYVAQPFLSEDPKRVMLNKTVTSIAYDPQKDAGVFVETADGCTLKAQRAIVTFSSSVINYAVRTSTLFSPPLPVWKADAYSRVGNGVYTKIFCKYAFRFWENADYVLFAHPSRRGYYAVWQDLESHGKFFKKGSNVLLVTVVQTDSQRVERQSLKQTINELQENLRVMYGPDIPDPLDIFVPRWNSDPHFRGSWSNVQVGTPREDFDLMQKQVGGLFFAAEATDATFNGFTLGGYNSGMDVASRVLESLNTRSQDSEVYV